MTSTGTSAASALLWSLVLLGGLAILGVTILWLRRWFFSARPPPAHDEWSLQHLREMRSKGELTDDEFEKLRSRVIGASSRGAAQAMNDDRPGDAQLRREKD